MEAVESGQEAAAKEAGRRKAGEAGRRGEAATLQVPMNSQT